MAAEGARHKIVIVEDEGLIAADLEARLKIAGYTVPGTADSAHKALQLIRKTSPDLVLMDVRLKGNVDGIEVADQVRNQLDIPVVFLTAYEDGGTLERAGRTQAFGYIKKPIASASLKGSIEMAIAKHRYERDLRAQRDWAVASFAAVPYSVLVTDRKGRVTYLNPRAEDLTGQPIDKAMGRSCWELLRLYYRQSGTPVQDFIPVAMLHGEPIPLPDDVCHKRDAKRSYSIEGIVGPRWHDGQMDGTIVALSDVTRSLFDLEQERQERKYEALERLVGGIARQLDESAQAEESRLEALPASLMHAETETKQRAANDVHTVASRLQAFLRAPEMHAERVDISPVLQQLDTAWKLIEPRLRLELNTRLAFVQVDSWQLTRALVSILLHARSRMKSDAVLTVELSDADVEQVIYSVRIRVSYATEEDATALEQVFEPAFTGPSRELHTAYKLVKRMGGLVAVRLERGDCATFDIYLPRVEAKAAGAAVPQSSEPAILLVDANAEVRRLLYDHFERNGCKLLSASGCDEALLLTELYPGRISLVIANLPAGDESRDWLSDRLSSVRPGISLRLLRGYSEPCRAAAGAALEPAFERHLTKADLLQWARESLEAEVTVQP
jgi:two-component system cell cycle sensor histidine kinase/response regulator CckA